MYRRAKEKKICVLARQEGRERERKKGTTRSTKSCCSNNKKTPTHTHTTQKGLRASTRKTNPRLFLLFFVLFVIASSISIHGVGLQQPHFLCTHTHIIHYRRTLAWALHYHQQLQASKHTLLCLQSFFRILFLLYISNKPSFCVYNTPTHTHMLIHRQV